MASTKPNRQILICGGGPAGLSAAMRFADLGWDDIVLVERRQGPSDFEQNKAFNYLVEPRGEKLLEQIGVADQLGTYGVATEGFTLSVVLPDGKQKTLVPPIVNPLRGTCYWIGRARLQQMLFDAIAARNDPRIRLLYGHRFAGFVDQPDGGVAAAIDAPDGSTITLMPDLVLGCDGLSSQVRAGLMTRPDVPHDHFRMIAHPSISAGLVYKVLELPACFAVHNAAGPTAAVDDHKMTYMIASALRPLNETMALFAFPVANSTEPRSVNIIREADHKIWKLATAEELLVFLEQSFPQLDVRSLVPLDQAQAFVNIDAGRFPNPQYAAHVHASLGSGRMQVVLLGDAGHAFPPDLGLGVNSALQDLDRLAQQIAESPDSLDKSCSAYERERLPESAALVRLVQTVFPEQYGHRPWRLRVWTLGFVTRKLLNKVAPFAFDKPAFLLSQEYWRSFVEIETMKRRTDLRLRVLGAVMLLLPVWLAVA